ncbi:MAG: tRNA (N6-isopentenyl adenosine(37)-C2)-methylthiotransferase MiaB [Chitinophagaceae bacterium]|nr:tRNA (N6-isopentenyl adenosine(37)-C2)-methylthiotransferase MiaB [Chitinophagaceae bacterium]
MELLETLNTKQHDESRQGEAFAPAYEQESVFKKHFYIESYGCAMNFADSEVIASILQNNGFGATKNLEEADLIFVNTCSIREKAELTVRKRLTEFKRLKKNKPAMMVGVLGCMAERLKEQFLEQEKLVDIVVGPDAYRSLPQLIQDAETGQKAVNVLLSRDETYGDISPIRLNSNGVNAFVSIMRGCNNMCSFCVVPFTRGRERSRDTKSILDECKDLFDRGYREVTLLGQNVDSYYFQTSLPSKEGFSEPGSLIKLSTNEALGSFDKNADWENPVSHFGKKIKDQELAETKALPLEGFGEAVTFAMLLERVAQIDPLLRVRFSTSHPKDITDEVLHTIVKYENICNNIHLPVQSGSTRVLQLMNRTYTREWYVAKVDRIKELIPDCGLSTDIITGFCTETEEDQQDTMSLFEYCRFDLAYMYFYSERPGTLAARRFKDDVPEAIKKRRLQEVIDLHRIHSLESMQRDVGKIFKVLIEGTSKKNEDELYGRNAQNKVIVFPKQHYKKGDYVYVKVNACTAGTLLGEAIN